MTVSNDFLRGLLTLLQDPVKESRFDQLTRLWWEHGQFFVVRLVFQGSVGLLFYKLAVCRS